MTSYPRNCLGWISAGLLLASPVAAQELTATDVGPEIVRDAATLVDVIRPHPDDPDIADTALIFTSKSQSRGRAVCKAFDKNGNVVGRAWLKVPGLGLRYALASDIANDLDFVGSVQCWASTNLIGSAILLAAGELTDLPVENGRFSAVRGRRVLFPVVATY